MKLKIAALAAAAVLFALPALADNTPTVATLVADGDGTVMVVPDIAIVTIGVVSRAKTASAALATNSTDLANAIAAVEANGVDAKDIGTSGFSIAPVYDQQPNRDTGTPAAIVGYDVTNEVQVTLRDIAKSGAILDKVISAGANRVNDIAFDTSDKQAANDAALKAAIAEARRKAAIMADAAGVKLVRILSVTQAQNSPQPMFARVAMAAAAPVPVMPGQQSVTATATITYEIAPQ